MYHGVSQFASWGQFEISNSYQGAANLKYGYSYLLSLRASLYAFISIRIYTLYSTRF